ncbi:MAG TPA: MBL fold metallo-hydrolase [Steroidobacteraceae bacterium]|jgi:glyoxylase-like metal-dependent hydrolase (beta-lactamase superfamily II)|nr:MBL fold metallo-hydrolase [Steroidobacteraceae bacterium]
MNRGCTALLVLFGAAALSPARAAERCEPAAVLAAAERAQGGPIHTLTIAGSGSDFVVGQGWRPRGPWPRFNVERYERSIDFDAPASSLVTVRSQALHPPRGGARQPFERTETVSAVAPGSPNGKALRRELALLLPAGFIDAARHSSRLSAKPLGSGCTLTVTPEEGAPITAELTADGRLKKLSSQTPDDVLGDAPVETLFTGRVAAGDRSVPARIVQKVGGYPVLDLRIARATVGEPVVVAEDRTPPLADWMAPPRMPAEQLGEGTFVMPGRYSALAVDLGEYIVLIECPQNQARAAEVIAEAHRLIPGKPIRYVVNTHAHFDHAAGLRAAVAEGATIVTHRSNVPFLRDALNRPRTLRPDALSSAPRPIELLPVDEQFSLKGGGREIRLYHLHGMDHVDGMLAAYLPESKVLVEADAFTPPAKRRTAPPATINPYNVQLLRNLERLGLDIERLISIHYAADGRRVGMDELRLATGQLPMGETHAEHRP